MSLYTCPRCGSQVSDRAGECPKCGLDYLSGSGKCPDCGDTIWLARFKEPAWMPLFDSTGWEGECPNCGYAVKREDSIGCVGCLVVVILAICLGVFGSCAG